MKNFIYIITMSISFASCQSLEIHLVTNPEGAEVSVFNPAEKGFIELGKAPLTITKELLTEKRIPIDQHLQILAKKAQYSSESILLDIGTRPKIDLAMKLDKDPSNEDNKQVEMNAFLESSIQKFIDVQRLVQNQRYDEAIGIVNQQLQRFPSSAQMWEMKGSLEILKKTPKLALESFDQSLKINPANDRLRSLYLKLKGGTL